MKSDCAELDPLVVCPVCRGSLSVNDKVLCRGCGSEYLCEGDRPVLLVPGDVRFTDESDCCLFSDEERTNTFTTRNYFIPLIRKLFPENGARRTILSAGCGVGADVDMLRESGFVAYGVDCGSRVEAWTRRRHKDAFQIGSVAHLPYADDTFDAVITGCLLPHIGVVGDTSVLREDAAAQRRRVAAELLRVTRPGGSIIMGCPNRLCPADLFHKRQMSGASSFARWHLPSERFLLSFGDHVDLFGDGAKVDTLPVSGYWGFHTKKLRLPTRMLAALLEAYFAVLSVPWLGMLRRSGLNPWLMVIARKAAN